MILINLLFILQISYISTNKEKHHAYMKQALSRTDMWGRFKLKILIPDNYQKAPLTLHITKLMKSHEVLVINNLAKECDLKDKLREIDILILIRERTIVDRNLLLKLPNLKLICQTGPIGSHIDIEACRDLGIEILVVEIQLLLLNLA